MSAKKHVLVPRSITTADIDAGFDRNSATFHHMTRQEARTLARAGHIRRLGASGNVWQLADDFVARPNWETGVGRISLEIDGYIQGAMFRDMRRRPAR